MKPGASSLNPYAEPYTPLANREGNNNVTAKDMNNGKENAWFEHSSHFAHNLRYNSVSLDFVTRGTDKPQFAEVSIHKNHHANGSLMQSSGEMTDKHVMDVDFDMEFEYLRMSFPGLSIDSIRGVYLANNEDLEAAIDMLNQLESYTVEPSGTLPDTLDIGDVSESVSSANRGAKLKNVASETSASSSGSAESDVAS